MDRGPQRYLLVKFFGRDPLSAKVVERAVHRSIEDMLGQLGSAELRTRMISFEETDSKGVFRCNSRSVEKLRAVLALMTHVDSSPVAAIVVRSSGTIKGLKVRVQRHRK